MAAAEAEWHTGRKCHLEWWEEAHSELYRAMQENRDFREVRMGEEGNF